MLDVKLSPAAEAELTATLASVRRLVERLLALEPLALAVVMQMRGGGGGGDLSSALHGIVQAFAKPAAQPKAVQG